MSELEIEVKRARGRPKMSEEMRLEKHEKKKEYLREYRKSHYQDNKDVYIDYSKNISKRNELSYKLIKKLFEENKIPSEYLEQAQELINVKLPKIPLTQN